MADAPQFADVYKNLPPGIPDEAYNNVRQGWFDNVLWPDLVSRGKAAPLQKQAAMVEFMRQSERPDKAEYPRLGVMGTSAVKALAAPVGALYSATGQDNEAVNLHNQLNRMEGGAAQEAQRQGINPTPYQMAGALAGSAPAFAAMSAMMPAGLPAVAEGALLGGVGGAAYEGASAPPGERGMAALRGALIGAPTGAALGGISRLLHGKAPAPEAIPEAMPEAAPEAIPQSVPSMVPSMNQAARRATVMPPETGEAMQAAPSVVDPDTAPLRSLATKLGVRFDDLKEKDLATLAQLQHDQYIQSLDAAAGKPPAWQQIVSPTLNPRDFEAPAVARRVGVDPRVGLTKNQVAMLEQTGQDQFLQTADQAQAAASQKLAATPAPEPIAPRARPATGVQSYTGGEPIPGVPADVDALTMPGEGTTYRTLSREAVAHESFHRYVIDALPNPEPTIHAVNPQMAQDLRSALPSEHTAPGGNYDIHSNEEVATRLLTAVRVNDDAAIQRFADADGGKDNVLSYAMDLGKTLQSEVSKLGDTPQTRAALDRLQHTVRRAGQGITELQAETRLNGGELKFDSGKFYFRGNGEKGFRVYDSRDALLNHLDENSKFPQAPEFAGPALPGVGLPPTGGPDAMRYFTTSDPAPVSLYDSVQGPKERPTLGTPGEGPVASGSLWFSSAIRDFLPWVHDVAKKANAPELYDAMLNVHGKQGEMERFLGPLQTQIADMFRGVRGPRRSDLTEYMVGKERLARGIGTQADVDAMASKLNLTPKEIAITEQARDFLKARANDFNVDPLTMVAEYVPRMRASGFDPDVVRAQEFRAPDNLKPWFKYEREGELNNRETDLAKILNSYTKIGAREKYMTDPIEQARNLVNGKVKVQDQIGEWKWEDRDAAKYGNLKDILNRHLDFMLGKSGSDWSYKPVMSFAKQVMMLMNDGMEKANKLLPTSLKMKPIDVSDAALSDSVQKLLTLQFGGGLAFRAMLPIRHLSQVFMAYPMLGEAGLIKGMTQAMSKGSWDLAERFGVLAQDNQLANMISGVGENPTMTGRLAQISQTALKPTRYAVNWARVAAFQGFMSKVAPAVERFAATGNARQLMRESGMHFMEPLMSQRYIRELTSGAIPKEELIGKIAADLTALSQWSATKGTAAGMYKFQLGRILGQYGTWPMHYLDYVRRMTVGGDMTKADRAIALSRLAVSHMAILKAGEALGVDTGNWVFTSPMGFAGGPNYQAATSVLKATDFNSPEGATARRNLMSPFLMTMPGYSEASGVWRAVEKNEPGLYLRLLGFNPMTTAKANLPLHKLSEDLNP